MPENVSTAVVKTPAPPPPPPETGYQTAAFEAHGVPTGTEQEHIKQALEASQTAMEAIQTLLSISTWVLGILAVILAVLALWGVTQIVRQARSAAKQIANARLNTYMKAEEFQTQLKDLVDASVRQLWQDNQVAGRLAEPEANAGEASPFPPPPGDGK